MRRRWNAGWAMAVVSAALVMGWPAPAGADGTRDQQWQVGYLDLARAHELSQGEGVTVAVIDTGVDGTHPDLEGNVLPGIDAYSVANGGQPGDGWNDTHGHGTAMAGLIAAHGHGPGNGDGALGIAPQAKIIPMRVSDGEGNAAYQQAMDLAIAEAISRDVDIISLSQRGFDLLGIEPALDAGILVVVAGGNAPGDGFVNAPSGSLVVGAVRADGSVADVTTRGIRPPPPVDELGSTTALQTGFLILTAPGEGITSTTLDHGYRSGTGTSDSTAIVSGAAALVMARYPDLTAEQVMSHLVETSTDKGAPGPDVDYGWGDLDIVRALETEPTIPTTTVTTQAPTTIAPQPGDGGETAGAEPGDGSDIAAPWLVVAVGAVVAAAAAFGLSAASRRRHAPAFAGTAVAPRPPGPARPGPIGAPPPPGPAPGPVGMPPPPGPAPGPIGAPPPPGPATPGPMGAPPPPGPATPGPMGAPPPGRVSGPMGAPPPAGRVPGRGKPRSAGVLAGVGVVAVVVAIAAGVYAVSGGDDGGGGGLAGGGTTVTTTGTGEIDRDALPLPGPANPAPTGTTYLDDLAARCFGGVMASCDTLTTSASGAPADPTSFDYLTYGQTCAGRKPVDGRLCVDSFADRPIP